MRSNARLMTTAFVTALGLTLVTLWLVVGQCSSIRADASIRYVAPDGDDSSLCDSIAGRCRTVQRAIDVAQPFDEIRVAGGSTLTLRAQWRPLRRR